MRVLSDILWFPDVSTASDEGIVAIGGDLFWERLLLAYRSGIFPWYNRKPILWWSPPMRMVLFPEEFRISKSLRKTIRNGTFEVTFNKAFGCVIENCAGVKRKHEMGTWINAEMQKAYKLLHQKGFAESVEVWQEDKLVGGLYGVNLKDRKIFCGESMFSLVSDASKVAFYHLVEYVKKEQYKLIDCQLYNDHLASLGAREILRREFMNILNTEGSPT